MVLGPGASLGCEVVVIFNAFLNDNMFLSWLGLFLWQSV